VTGDSEFITKEVNILDKYLVSSYIGFLNLGGCDLFVYVF